MEKEKSAFRKLPVFKGYAVDGRLREFRKVTWKKGEAGIEFVPFDSEKGEKLLMEGFLTGWDDLKVKRLVKKRDIEG